MSFVIVCDNNLNIVIDWDNILEWLCEYCQYLERDGGIIIA